MVAQLRLLERPDGVLSPIPSESDVHFFCVGRDRWSIYDRRLDPATPGAFLGRLHRMAGVYEIAFADESRPRVWCSSLSASKAEFVGGGSTERPTLRLV